MTAADFRRDVERELEQLRRAHVITDVEVETDLVVGVRFNIDGKRYDAAERARDSQDRLQAFDRLLEIVRAVRRDVAPSRRPTPPRPRIPLERQGGEPGGAAVLAIALLCVLVLFFAWLLDYDIFPREETSGPQRRVRVGARTTAGNPTAKRGGSVGDDPAECVPTGSSQLASAPRRLEGRLL